MGQSPSVKVFSIVFAVVYTAVFMLNAPPFMYQTALFRYFPAVNQWSLGPVPGGGPAILWYGWMATALLISLVVTVLVPRKLAERVSPSYVWGVPVLVLIGILVYVRRWFY